MIVHTYSAFRWRLAEVIREAATVEFVVASPCEIVRSSGSFVAAGYEEGMALDVLGAVDNSRRFTIRGVDVLTLTVDEDVATEAPIACELAGYWLDGDGLPEYPGAFSRGSDLVRANGFDGGVAIVNVQDVNFDARFSVNAEAADAVNGVDEYDWWLSDRTDDNARRFLTIEHEPPGPETYSGTVTIGITALAQAEVGIASLAAQLTKEDLVALFTHAHLYVRRIADGAIQWVDVLGAHLARVE